MPRERKGSYDPKKNRVRVVVTEKRVDGTTRPRRVWIDPREQLTLEQGLTMAQKLTEHYRGRVLTTEEIDRGLFSGGKPRSIADFVRKTYLPTRVDQDTYALQVRQWNKHILPILGKHDVQLFDAEHLRALVAALDEKVADHRTKFGWKTAVNVWGLVTRFCKDLFSHKEARIRLRKVDVAHGVRGPERGDKPNKQWLYPRELDQLLSCARIPVERRRTWALLVYFFARAGEVKALDWEKVNLENQVVTIDRARGLRSGVLSQTKTHDVRAFPIEPVLLPMLRAMRAEGASFGGSEHGAKLLREDLRVAGITRLELFRRQGSSLPITQHDLRATGITYLAMRGDKDDFVRGRAGHTDFKMTEVYLRRGRQMAGAALGEPFQPLPPSLLERDERLRRTEKAQDSARRFRPNRGAAGNLRSPLCEGKDLNLSEGAVSTGKTHPAAGKPSAFVASGSESEPARADSRADSGPRVFSAAVLALAGIAFRLGVMPGQVRRAA
jgi:integrase